MGIPLLRLVGLIKTVFSRLPEARIWGFTTLLFRLLILSRLPPHTGSNDLQPNTDSDDATTKMLDYYYPYIEALMPAKLPAFLGDFVDRYAYGWGEKLTFQPSLAVPPIPFNWTNPRHKVCCSGFVKAMLEYAQDSNPTRKAIAIPDGSYFQNAWCIRSGFKRSSFASAHLRDGAVRLAYLPATESRPGHVMLIINGRTLESHGSTRGPSSRVWGSEPFMAECLVYVLAPPDPAYTAI